MKIKLDENFYKNKDEVIVCAIDPGQTIGLALGMLGRVGLDTWEARFTTRTYDWPAQAKDLEDIELALADVVVVENWVFIPGKQQLANWQSAIEVKGFVRGTLAAAGNLDRLTLQSPATKEYASPGDVAWLFGDGLGKTHRWDAARHLIVFLRRDKHNGKH